MLFKKNPKADDRDQAYAALFNKAIEHDWFSDVEELAGHYLQSPTPMGQSRHSLRSFKTMARVHAGQVRAGPHAIS